MLIPKFKILRDILELKELKTLYYSLVESHINYGILGWGSVAKYILKRVEIVQKTIIKIMYKKPTTYPTDQMYKETKIMDSRQLFFVQCNIQQHKNKQNLTQPSHNYNIRHNNYVVPYMKKTVGQKSYTYLGPKLYNSLPLFLKSITSQNSFKYQIKQYTLTLTRQSVHSNIECNL